MGVEVNDEETRMSLTPLKLNSIAGIEVGQLVNP